MHPLILDLNKAKYSKSQSYEDMCNGSNFLSNYIARIPSLSTGKLNLQTVLNLVCLSRDNLLLNVGTVMY